MNHVSRPVSHGKGLCPTSKVSAFSVVLLGMCAAGGAQAAQLTCGTPLRISTAKATWSTDARYMSAPTGAPAAIVDDYKWSGWFDKTTATHPAGAGTDLANQPITADWLSFGDSTFTAGSTNSGNTTSGSYPAGTQPYPAVITNGVVANGALVAGRVSFTYNDKITIAPNVDLSTIKLKGSGGFDDGTLLLVKPDATPDPAVTSWIRTSASFNGYAAPQLISVDGSTTGLGFYYGSNTIGFAVQNAFSAPTNTAGNPTGLIADFELTADCLPALPPQPAAVLSCPAGTPKGTLVETGLFTTNARDWKWTWRTQAGVLQNVEQPLFDTYRFRDYFDPNKLAGAAGTVSAPTQARWISPGTTTPYITDIPGVPYPKDVGQNGTNGAVFTMNQPITIGNNVDPATIKLAGRFAFDNYGDSVFVQPVGQPHAPISGHNDLPDGYGGFTNTATSVIAGFQTGPNIIGLGINGGEADNTCSTGLCALAAIGEFKVTAQCTGADPIALSQAITFPAQASHKVADGAFSLSPVATASSALAVSYSSLTPAVCDVTPDGTVTPKTTGTCTIAADQPGNTDYTAAPQVTRNIALTSNATTTTVTSVPTLGTWALGLLAGLLGVVGFRRRSSVQ